MNLRRLRCFVTAADEGNFGRAADRLNIAHSAFSRQIAHLEGELGAELFIRQGRRVVLSDIGITYAARVRPILAALADAAHEARRMQGQKNAAIMLGLQEHIGGHADVVRALQRMRSDGIGALITVRPMGTSEMVAALNDDVIDLGLAYGEPTLLPVVSHRVVGYDRYDIAMSAEHPFATKADLRIEDLRGEHFIHIDSEVNKGLQVGLMAGTRAAGLEMDIIQRVPRVSGLMSLLSANLGIAFMPQMIAKPSNIVTRQVVGLDIAIPLTLIWRLAERREQVLHAINLCASCLRDELREPA